MEEDLKLYNSWYSPFGYRVIQALKIKGIEEYEIILEDLSNKSASLLEYNPVNKLIPVFVHRGKPICESLVILEYIDDTWKHNPLLPLHPYDKSVARFLAKFGDEKVFPSVREAYRTKGKEQEQAVIAARENFNFVEDSLKGKKFFGGDKIGYVDLAFGWMANLISILEEIVDLRLVDSVEFPLLSEWMINFRKSSVIEECWPPHDETVVKFKTFFN